MQVKNCLDSISQPRGQEQLPISRLRLVFPIKKGQHPSKLRTRVGPRFVRRVGRYPRRGCERHLVGRQRTECG